MIVHRVVETLSPQLRARLDRLNCIQRTISWRALDRVRVREKVSSTQAPDTPYFKQVLPKYVL